MSRAMRVVLLSSTQFGRACLERSILPSLDAKVVGVITTPPSIRVKYSADPLRISNHAQFQDIADREGFPVLSLSEKPEKGELQRLVEPLEPDLILVLGWYYIVPPSVTALPRHGCLGLHASLLPKYRGGAPLTWALIHGEKETGISLFHFVPEIDAGDLVDQAVVPIGPDETIGELYARVTDASMELLARALTRIAAGTAERRPQDHAKASYFPPRTPKDGAIDWFLPARRVHDFVRAQTKPYPGAFGSFRSVPVQVWRTRPLDRDVVDAAPGTITRVTSEGPVVKCGLGSVVLLARDGPVPGIGERFDVGVGSDGV